MAPILEAIRTEYSYTRHDGNHVYKGHIDKDWTIGSVPHGGYVLSVIMDAVLKHQAKPHSSAPVQHLDPAHLNAQFLAASSIAPLEVHIKTFSNSKRWTRLDIAMFQPNPRAHIKGEPILLLRIRAHCIFTTLPKNPIHPTSPSPDNMWVLPNSDSDYGRLIPMLEHPAKCVENKVPNVFAFKKWMKWFTGVKIVGAAETGRKNLDWGCWFQLVGDEEVDVRTNAALLPLFADLFHNGPETLPPAQRPSLSWYPTLTFSLDFKSPYPIIPTTYSKIAKRTLGLYSRSSFISDGRHDQTVEVWSSPSELSERGVEVGSEEWRKGSVIMGISTQMALVLPFAVNAKKQAKELKGAKL